MGEEEENNRKKITKRQINVDRPMQDIKKNKTKCTNVHYMQAKEDLKIANDNNK